MHIITGLILSRLLSGSSKEPKFKGFKGVIEIIHLIPGRVRFLIPGLKNEPEIGLQITSQLEKAGPLKTVSANPITGSLLIEFNKEEIDVETITGVLVKMLGLEEAIEKAPQSLVSKELKDIYKSLDSSIYEYSNGLMDLNSVITTAFLTLGVYSLIRKRNLMPPGLGPLYWAYVGMRGA